MDMAGVDFFLKIDGCGDELCRAIGEGRDGMVASVDSGQLFSRRGSETGGWSSCLDKMRAPAKPQPCTAALSYSPTIPNSDSLVKGSLSVIIT